MERKALKAFGLFSVLVSILAALIAWFAYRSATVSGVILTVGFFASLISVLEIVIHGPIYVAVHQQGIRCTTRRGEESMFWDDVRHVFLDAEVIASPVGPAQSATAMVSLVDYEGRRLVIPRGVKRIGEFWDWLQRTISRPLIPGAKANLNDGGTLYFGPVVLSKEHLRVRGRSYLFDDIKEVRATPATITFVRRQWWYPRITVALKDLPHPSVFLALVSECARLTSA